MDETEKDKKFHEIEDMYKILTFDQAQPKDHQGQIAQLQARITMLEENFARLCTVVGRLEQQVKENDNGSPEGEG